MLEKRDINPDRILRIHTTTQRRTGTGQYVGLMEASAMMGCSRPCFQALCDGFVPEQLIFWQKYAGHFTPIFKREEFLLWINSIKRKDAALFLLNTGVLAQLKKDVERRIAKATATESQELV